jgi:ParB family chromosome partitioning protein
MSERPLFGEITSIEIDHIDATDRLRPVDPAHIEAIAASIAQSGLHAPVIVRPEGNRYRLIAGAHRMAACRSLGWTTIDAIIQNVEGDEARLIEIDENLMRRELSALDRAISLSDRKAIYDRLFPEAKLLGRKPKKMSQTLRQFGERFSKHAAKRTGLSERAVQMSLELAGKLSPEARDLLRLSDIADNQAQLLALAAEEPDRQVAMARVIADGKASSPKAARLALGIDLLVEEDPQDKLVTQFLALWARADQRTRGRIADHIAGAGKVKKARDGGGAP